MSLLAPTRFTLTTRPGGHQRATREVAHAGGAFTRVVSLATLVQWIEDRALATPAQDVPTGERLSVLLELALRRAELRTSIDCDPMSVAASLLGVVDLLSLHGFHRAARPVVPPGPGRAIVQAHLDLLHSLTIDFRDAVAKRGMDEVARLERAIELLRTLDLDREIDLDLEVPVPPLLQKLLVALEGVGCRIRAYPDRPVAAEPDTMLHALLTFAPRQADLAPDQSFFRVSCRDPQAEAEAAAALVLDHLRRGQSPSEIAIQVPEGEGYGDLLQRVFAANGLSLAVRDRLSIAHTPLVQAFRAFMRLWAGGPDAFDLSTVLGARGSGIRGAIRDRLCAAILSNLPATWDQVRAIVAEKLSEDAHEDARTAVQTLVDEIADVATVKDAARAFAGKLGNPYLLAKSDLSDRDILAHQQAALALREAINQALARSAPEFGARSHEAVSAFLRAVEGMLPDSREAISAGAIEVRLGSDATGPVDHLLILGFNRGRWPARIGHPPLLGELEREALRACGMDQVPLAADLAEREAMRTRAVLGQARRRLTVFTPARDAQGKATAPSLTLVDLLERLAPASRARWHLEADLVFGTPGAMALAPGLGNDRPEQPTERQALRAIASSLGARIPLPGADKESIDALVRRDRAYPLAAPWLPSESFSVRIAFDAKREYSASSLEALLTCRFKFYLEHVLGLRRIELGRSPELDKRLLGTIAHKVLDALGTTAHGAAAEKLETALFEVIERDYPWASAPRYKLQVAAIRQALERFLPEYGALAKQWGFDGGQSEVKFGIRHGRPVGLPLRDLDGLYAALGTDALALQGAVDRLESVTSEDVPRLLGIDFKLGGSRKFEGLHGLGLGIQAALYPLAIEQLFPGKPLLGFAYLSIDRRQGVFMLDRRAPHPAVLRPLSLEGQDVQALRDLVDQRLAEQLAILVGSRADGERGNVAPHSTEFRAELEEARGKSCEYCAGGLLCRFQRSQS